MVEQPKDENGKKLEHQNPIIVYLLELISFVYCIMIFVTAGYFFYEVTHWSLGDLAGSENKLFLCIIILGTIGASAKALSRLTFDISKSEYETKNFPSLLYKPFEGLLFSAIIYFALKSGQWLIAGTDTMDSRNIYFFLFLAVTSGYFSHHAYDNIKDLFIKITQGKKKVNNSNTQK